MASAASTGSIETMFRHLPVIKGYARRVILEGGNLTDAEELDRLQRLREFWAIGSSLNWTDDEIAVLLFRELFAGN